jgi:hypothetical protein
MEYDSSKGTCGVDSRRLQAFCAKLRHARARRRETLYMTPNRGRRRPFLLP